MASSPSSTAETLDPSPNPQPELDNPSSQPNPTPSSTPLPPPPPPPNPNSNAPLISPPQSQPPSISYGRPPLSGVAAIPPTAPSFRPAAPIPQFSQVSIPNFQNPSVGVQPPGVGVSSVSPMFPLPGSVPQYMMPYQVPLGQPPNAALRTFAPMPNGYAAMPTAGPQGTMLPPVIPRYPSPYPAMVRPAFPRPPGAIGVLPAVPRPPIPGIPGVRPIIPTIVRPALLPSAAPAEKPQTTVYVGKIASTVENDFMDSLLKFCGPFKSWKRAENPTDGTPRGFGFCEFETAEGVLRALRLLSKFNIDGQELVLNVNQATREYLERYVEKKTQNAKKLNETQTVGAEKLDDSAPVVEKNEPPKPSEEDFDSKKDDNDSGNKENQDIANFGIVTDEDREADQEVMGKLTNIIEERLKAKPLPPPPARVAVDGSGNSNSEFPAKSRDGDSDADVTRNDATEDKNDDEIISDAKQASEHDRTETSSPDRSRRYDRRSRDKERERDVKREKEREIERYEREAERGRIKKERDQRRKIEDAEREYEERLKDWEYREREKEKQRQYEKEKEKERERKRKKEIIYEEDEEEEDSRKKWRRSVLEEKRKKRVREYEDDLADRRKEEEEIWEAKRRAEEEQQLQQQRDALKLLSEEVTKGNEKPALAEETTLESRDKIVEQDHEGHSGHENHKSDGISENGIGDESTTTSSAVSDVQQSGNAPAKKLGFGLVGSGKRTAVPSVFHEEDEDAHKEKKMRPLVPIDYSTEELEAVQPSASGAPTLNLAAAAEFAKRISNPNSKEEKLDGERERSRRARDRSSQRERDRNNEDANHRRDENKEKILDRDKDREHRPDKLKTLDNKKLLDAKSKQLIDMIPRTKEELFSYDVNWAVYDKHELHERMRPWISKKITEFLGEEETTLVDYIVSSTREHVKASQMLELLQSILDDEAERFVLIMWRMLIFEIKKVETGISSRPKT